MLKGQCIAFAFLPHSWPNTLAEDVSYLPLSVTLQSLSSLLSSLFSRCCQHPD